MKTIGLQVPESQNYMLYFYGFKHQINKKRKKKNKCLMEKSINSWEDVRFSGAFVNFLDSRSLKW